MIHPQPYPAPVGEHGLSWGHDRPPSTTWPLTVTDRRPPSPPRDDPVDNHTPAHQDSGYSVHNPQDLLPLEREFLPAMSRRLCNSHRKDGTQ